MQFSDISQIIVAMGLLSLATNIITEVLKYTVPKLPSRIAVVIIAIALTVGSFMAYSSIVGFQTEWYMIAAAVIAGFFVSYIAQFGFDKFKELIKRNTEVTLTNMPKGVSEKVEKAIGINNINKKKEE